METSYNNLNNSLTIGNNNGNLTPNSIGNSQNVNPSNKNGFFTNSAVLPRKID